MKHIKTFLKGAGVFFGMIAVVVLLLWKVTFLLEVFVVVGFVGAIIGTCYLLGTLIEELR